MSRYRALANDLKAAILDGTHPVGSRMPSESELAGTYDVARGTVRQAFALLVGDGLISSRKGTRRLVLEQPRVQGFNDLLSFSQWAAAIGEPYGGRLIELVRREATTAEAEQLGVDRVYHLTRVRLLSGQPVMVERTAYVERIGALVAGIDMANESLTMRLNDLGVVISHASHTISSIGATADDARLLGVRPATPLLRELRRSTDPDGLPLEWSDDRYIGDAVSFTVHNSVIRGRS